MLANENYIPVLNKKLSVKLYVDLIKQLNKDTLLSGIDFSVEDKISPTELVAKITNLLKRLVENDYQLFSQFMYRLDVSESKINNLKETKLDKLIEELTRLVLERLFQKVYLKRQYNKG